MRPTQARGEATSTATPDSLSWRVSLASLGLAGARAATPPTGGTPITWLPDAQAPRRIGLSGTRSELIIQVFAERPGPAAATLGIVGLGRIHLPLGERGDASRGILHVPRDLHAALAGNVDVGPLEWHQDFVFLTTSTADEIKRSVALAGPGGRELWRTAARACDERDPVRAAIIRGLA